MHALKLPLTGALIGGGACAALTALATTTPTHRLPTLLSATGLVLSAKAAAAPHTPPTAYIAVGYQGLSAALIFSLIPNLRLAAPLFTTLAMIESAAQKLLVLTLMFGVDFWTSLNTWLTEASQKASWLPDTLGVNTLAMSYLGLYTLWGLLLGVRLGTWPTRAQALQGPLLRAWRAHPPPTPKASQKKRTPLKKIALICLAAGITLLTMPTTGDALLTLARATLISATLAALTPLTRALIRARGAQATSAEATLTADIHTQGELFAFCWGFYDNRARPIRLILAFEGTLALSVALHTTTSPHHPTGTQ
jgi:hypothetical protein